MGNEDKAVDKAQDALQGCDLVLVPAGVPRKPGQDRKDLLTINADIAKGTVEACAKFCPDAVIGLIVNPVNSVVPAMCELWKKAGLNPKKIPAQRSARLQPIGRLSPCESGNGRSSCAGRS